MPSPLHEHLTDRLGASYRQLERALAGVDEAAAGAGANPAWRRIRFGVGLDGSIAGIVYHVAAWKAIMAAGLEQGVFPSEGAVHPPASGWEGLLAWLAEGQARLVAALAARGPEGMEEEVILEGERMTVRLLFTHAMEHDQYHAGQVNLLQQLREPSGDG
jgi:hypothetical protein